MLKFQHPARVLISASLLLALVTLGEASGATVTAGFEGVAAGTVVGGTNTFGGQVSSDPWVDFNITAFGNQGPSSAIIFDTAHPTGNDADLGTPNAGFGGPGIGVGGAPGTPGENRKPQGKVVIIPKELTDVNRDGRVDDPNDSGYGGRIAFLWAAPAVVTRLTMVDVEEAGGVVNQFRNGQLIASFPIIPLGDNSQLTMNIGTRQPVDKTEIVIPGSGSVAELTYDFTPLPVESTTWSTIKSLYDGE